MADTLFLCLVTISLAFFAESIFGFGGGLLAVPVLSLILGVKDAVTLVLIFQFLMGLLIIRSYKVTNWKVALPMTAGLVGGTLLGTYVLSSVDGDILKKFLAISIILFLIRMVFFKKVTFGRTNNAGVGTLTGGLGGLFQGILGTGGPVLTMYLAGLSLNKDALRATLIYLFFVTSIIRVVTSFSTGLFNDRVVSLALPIVPMFLIVILLGSMVHKKLDEKYYQYCVQIVLFIAAISLLLKK